MKLATLSLVSRGINFVRGVAGLGLNVTSSGARSLALRYRLELVNGYSVGGQDRIAAIWTK